MLKIKVRKLFNEVLPSLWVFLRVAFCFGQPESHGRISDLECESIQPIDCRDYIDEESFCWGFHLVRRKVLFIGIFFVQYSLLSGAGGIRLDEALLDCEYVKSQSCPQ